MNSNVYHVDQNVIIVHLDKSKDAQKQQFKKINKEKLKIILQISGCKAQHSFKLCERIFEQIFSKLVENFDKQRNNDLKQQSKNQMNSATITEKYFRELVYTNVLEKKYMKEKEETYKEDFKIAWTLTERKQPIIILLGGTSGTGKSTVSSILASRFGISTVLSTDSIRHIMRNFISKEENPILFASTYEAGKFIKDDTLSDSRRVIKGYKLQCELVQQRLEDVVQSFSQKSDSIIIEGVHLTPMFMFRVLKKFNRVLPFSMCIKKESKHKERFAVRSKYMTLDSRNNKYIENFQNIRLIQKWLSEKADEYLIPKVDNVNIDKSIDTIHRTILQYMKKVFNGPDIDWNEQKNALPFYEEYNKINRVVWSSKEVKDYIHSTVNKTEIYEQFLQQMNESKQAPKEQDLQDQYLETESQSQSKNKVWLQQSVQKFNELNMKNEKGQGETNNSTEVNYIVDEVEKKDNMNHLSDQEDQSEERRRRNQDSEPSKVMKKAKSLKAITSQNKQDDEQDETPTKTNKQNEQEDNQIQLVNQFHHIEKNQVQQLKVAFMDEVQQEEVDDREQTPQKTDYKGLLHHLSKHKRLFLSKKIKSSNLEFIKKMIENYNQNYQSHDRIKLIQNQDGSYCLFKINVHKTMKKSDSREDALSEQDDSSIVKEQRTYTNFPFSEKREYSDVDSLRLRNEQESDENESLKDDQMNSVEGSSSEEDEDSNQLDQMKQQLNEDDDSFELQKISEEDEFKDSEVDDPQQGLTLQASDLNGQFADQSPDVKLQALNDDQFVEDFT